MIPFNEFLNSRKATVDEENRMHLQCLCDGTFLFLYEMVNVLQILKCTDIKTGSKVVTEGVPQDEPWCNCLFTASGILPDGVRWVTTHEESQ